MTHSGYKSSLRLPIFYAGNWPLSALSIKTKLTDFDNNNFKIM